MGRCKQCQERIEDSADKCHYCGYEPRVESAKETAGLFLIGLILTLTIVGSVLGLPMICYAIYQLYDRDELKPATHDPA